MTVNLCDERQKIARDIIHYFLTEEKEWHPRIESINEGSCGEFASMVNGRFKEAGMSEMNVLSTFDFISPTADGLCEFMKDWNEDEMMKFGVPNGYFIEYRKNVESIDKRGAVGYHVWLYDGENHYDATCLHGTKNPLELPFFQIFVKK